MPHAAKDRVYSPNDSHPSSLLQSYCMAQKVFLNLLDKGRRFPHNGSTPVSNDARRDISVLAMTYINPWPAVSG